MLNTHENNSMKDIANNKDRGDQRDKESYSICEMPMIGTEEKREREFNKVRRSVESLVQFQQFNRLKEVRYESIMETQYYHYLLQKFNRNYLHDRKEMGSREKGESMIL